MPKKTEVKQTEPNNRAEELRNLLNATLKTDMGRMADDEVYRLGFWPTGILPIDAALGGGWARGRMGLCYGESATLKSLIALATVAQVQKAGGTAVYIDLEHSFTPSWAEQIGIDNSKLILLHPETGEEAMDAAEIMVRSDADLIAVDSIAAMLPRSERELQLSGKDHNQPANIARLMALSLRKLTSANTKTTILWISQMRDNIGGMAFSPKSNVTGGKAKHYFVSQELVSKKTGKVYETVTYFDGDKEDTGKKVVAQKFMVELTKTRFGQPFNQSYFLFDTVNGRIDNTAYLIQQGLIDGLITKAGAWWTYQDVDSDGVVGEEYKAGSKDKFYELILSNEEAKAKLLARVCAKYNLNPENYNAK